MNYRWMIAPPAPNRVRDLASSFSISPLLAQCLINRQISDPNDISLFLEPRLRQLQDPCRLPDMPRAVERLWQARARAELVVVFGDYDVDGVSSAAILIDALGTLGWRVEAYLPNRIDEGYGLSAEAASNCLARFAARVLLAVDCGSNAAPVVDDLAGRGIDVIILDHHQVSSPPERAAALVNPQRGADLASRDLCSAGLAFKLAHALVKRGRAEGLASFAKFDLRRLLDFAALGVIADMVPLLGENRIIAAAGLERLNRSERPGLAALKTEAGLNQLRSAEVAFYLAPRLNAAGRLETAEKALRLLLTRDPAEAGDLARQLNAHNRERQRLERQTFLEASALVRHEFGPDSWIIVAGRQEWHIGVVGIVAARILKEFYRPTLIFGGDGAHWRGSGRSIDGFDLAAHLRQCEELLLRHGGHAMAAGATIEPDKLALLRQRLNELARRQLGAEDLQPRLRADAEVSLPDLTLEQITELERLDPHGLGNPEAQFVCRSVQRRSPMRRIGKENRHARFWVAQNGAGCEAVYWNAPEIELPESCDLAVAPRVREYRGDRAVQLKILDWQKISK